MYQASDAAVRCRGPVWRCADQAQNNQASCELEDSYCVPGPDLTDHLPLPFVDLLTRPTFLGRSVQSWISKLQLQEPDSLRLSSAWPRSRAPFCWRARATTTAAACAPACDAASLPLPVLCGRPIG